MASKELANVKTELTLLQNILEQKDKELNLVRAAKTKFLDLMSREQTSNVSKITDSLKDELKVKEEQLMEVDMKLRFSESKVKSRFFLSVLLFTAYEQHSYFLSIIILPKYRSSKALLYRISLKANFVNNTGVSSQKKLGRG